MRISTDKEIILGVCLFIAILTLVTILFLR